MLMPMLLLALIGHRESRIQNTKMFAMLKEDMDRQNEAAGDSR